MQMLAGYFFVTGSIVSWQLSLRHSLVRSIRYAAIKALHKNLSGFFLLQVYLVFQNKCIHDRQSA
jgi:hypothetical protein